LIGLLVSPAFVLSLWPLAFAQQSPGARSNPDAPAPALPPENPAVVAAMMKDVPAVTAPPETFFTKFRPNDQAAARAFYKKYLNLKGVSVAASDVVADEALQRTYYLVMHLLAGRPDIIQAMADHGTRLIIIGKNQVYTDMPEYRNNPNPAYQNERVRGTGGLDVTSFGEENLLNLPLDRYDDESIGVHEFCHTIDAALRQIDTGWRTRLRTTYQTSVQRKGLWKGAYNASNQAEYWAEICQDYFDCDRANNWNHAWPGRREQLKEYDPDGYELVRSTFHLTPETDWRFVPMRTEPSVIAPPEQFKIDPYYTKFTWAREFTVVGNKASDEAMLKANAIVRKMFAYRHDILKALIADDVKLVVLGPGEKISDLPEYKKLEDKKDIDELARCLDYSPQLKLLGVGQENVLGDIQQPYVGPCRVISIFAKAIYAVAGTRPVDAGWDSRPGQVWQQYELRLKRVDVGLSQKMQELFDNNVTKKGMWKGTPAMHSPIDYWAEGVLAYFDATGQVMPPDPVAGATDVQHNVPHGITTREALKAYDPELYDVVNQTMAYDGHVDWRYGLW
jgi:hypothetical protein